MVYSEISCTGIHGNSFIVVRSPKNPTCPKMGDYLTIYIHQFSLHIKIAKYNNTLEHRKMFTIKIKVMLENMYV
jgi:hypothetical protein